VSCFFSGTFAAIGRFKLTDIPPTYILTLSDGLRSANCLWHAVAATTGSLVLPVVGVLPRGPTRQEGFISHLSGINFRALHMLSSRQPDHQATRNYSKAQQTA
jgi:hypothetical protein